MSDRIPTIERRMITLRLPESLVLAALAQAAQQAIAARITELGIDELGARWRCTSRKEVLRKCRERGVAVRRERGRKEAYVLLADVEAASERIRRESALPEGVKLTPFHKAA